MNVKDVIPVNRQESFVNVTNDREAHPKRWVAALVQMNCEKKIGAKLDKLGVENYIPIQIETHQWSDRKRKRDRILDLFFGFKYRMYVSINWRGDNIVSGLFEPFKPKEERGGFNAKKISLTNHIACLIMMIKDRMFLSSINQSESISKYVV